MDPLKLAMLATAVAEDPTVILDGEALSYIERFCSIIVARNYSEDYVKTTWPHMHALVRHAIKQTQPLRDIHKRIDDLQARFERGE